MILHTENSQIPFGDRTELAEAGWKGIDELFTNLDDDIRDKLFQDLSIEFSSYQQAHMTDGLARSVRSAVAQLTEQYNQRYSRYRINHEIAVFMEDRDIFVVGRVS